MNLFAAQALLWEHFREPFLLALALGLALPVAGAMLAARRAPLFAVALPQAAYAGAAAGLFLGPYLHVHDDLGGGPPHEPPTIVLKLGALAFTVLAAGWIARNGIGARAASGGARAGVVLVAMTALAEVFRSLSPFGDQRLEPILHGEAIAVGGGEALFTGGVVTAAALGLLIFRRTLDFAAAEPSAARAAGVRTGPAAVAFFGTTALIVAVATPVTGPLLVLAGLLAGPSLLIGRVGSVGGLLAFSSGSGLVGAYFGATASVSAEIPLGAAAALGITATAAALSVVLRTVGRLRTRTRTEA